MSEFHKRRQHSLRHFEVGCVSDVVNKNTYLLQLLCFQCLWNCQFSVSSPGVAKIWPHSAFWTCQCQVQCILKKKNKQSWRHATGRWVYYRHSSWDTTWTGWGRKRRCRCMQVPTRLTANIHTRSSMRLCPGTEAPWMLVSLYLHVLNDGVNMLCLAGFPCSPS